MANTYTDVNGNSIKLVDLNDGTYAIANINVSDRTATAHRTAVTATDKCVVATIVPVAQDAVIGVMTNEEHKVAYAPGNVYGSAGVSTIASVTPTLNKTVDIPIAQVVGATYYDIFFSIDAAPKWVGRVTEAQRVTGCAITAVGTVGEGGSAGVVNVRLVGTDDATTATQFTVNNAYIPPATGVSCLNKSKAFVNVIVDVDDLRSIPTLKLIPFLKNGNSYYQGAIQEIVLLTAVGKTLQQYFTVDVDSADELYILVELITGEGTAATIQIETV